MAHAHYSKVQTFTKNVFNSNPIWNRDIDKYLSVENLLLLKEQTPISLSDIKKMKISAFEGSLFREPFLKGNFKWILPTGIFHRKRNRHGLLFCPGCLEKDGDQCYYRKKWRLSLSVVCPICKIKLKACCPKCKSTVIYFRVELGKKETQPEKPINQCYHCSFDYRKARRQRASDLLVKQQKYLYNLIDRGFNDQFQFSFLYFDVLYAIVSKLSSKRKYQENFYNFVIDWFSLKKTYLPIKSGHLFEYKSLECRIHLLSLAILFLDNFDSEMLTEMKRQKISGSFLLRDMPYIPYWYHSKIRAYLY